MVPGQRGYAWSWLSTMLNKVISGEAKNLVLFEGLMHQFLLIAGYFLEGMYRQPNNRNAKALYDSIRNCPAWAEAFKNDEGTRWGVRQGALLYDFFKEVDPTGVPLGKPGSSYATRKKHGIDESDFENKMLAWIQYCNI